jgi:hypothetical protein
LRSFVLGLNLLSIPKIWQKRSFESFKYNIKLINIDKIVNNTQSFLYSNKRLLIRIGNLIWYKKQIRKSIFKYNKKWFRKASKNKWDRKSLFRAKYLKDIFIEKNYNYYFRKLLSKVFNKAQVNLEFKSLLLFYKAFISFFFITIMKQTFLFKKRFFSFSKKMKKIVYFIRRRWKYFYKRTNIKYKITHKIKGNLWQNKLYAGFLFKSIFLLKSN